MRSDLPNGEGARPAERPFARLRSRLRDSRWLILFELAAVAAIFAADDLFHVIFFSKTLYLLVLAWVSLFMRGVRWRDIGMRPGPKWPLLVLGGLVGGAVMEAFELFVSQPVLMRLTGEPPDLSDFHSVIGNWKLLGLGLLLIWTLAAFGEELVYRGWLLNRLSDLFGRKPAGWVVAAVVCCAVFGSAHLYQGITGVSENAIDGLALTLMYFAAGRNLWVPIIAHGVQDTTDLVLVFTNHYPTPV
ncbi:MAG: CPBP family intramembrane metalloprotease [Proteobacteria bacterium]|nr:CPBP family intramembrane metalloprotease [Pseudomonadota bacterium]